MITHDELQILLIGSLELHDDHPPFGLRPVSYCTTPRSWLPLSPAVSLLFSDRQITKGLIVTEKSRFMFARSSASPGISGNFLIKWAVTDKDMDV